MLTSAILGISLVGQLPPSMWPVRYDSFVSEGALYHEVRIHPDQTKTAMDVDFANAPKPFRLFADSTEPAVVVTGTFFHPRSGYPVGDIVVEGNLLAHGMRGSALRVGWDGKRSIFDTPFQGKVDWSEARFGLRGLVRVVQNGKVCPNPKAQKFRDPSVWRPAERVAIGLTKDGTMKIFATNKEVILSQLGRAMVKRGVVEAVNLDGGSSTAMYYRGKTIIAPKRRLSNVVRVFEQSAVVSQSIPW